MSTKAWKKELPKENHSNNRKKTHFHSEGMLEKKFFKNIQQWNQISSLSINQN